MGKPVYAGVIVEYIDGSSPTVYPATWGKQLAEGAAAVSPADQLTDLLNRAGREQWRVYSYDAGDWMPTGSTSNTPGEAREKQHKFAARHPCLPTAVVRETVTYQIEDSK